MLNLISRIKGNPDLKITTGFGFIEQCNLNNLLWRFISINTKIFTNYYKYQNSYIFISRTY